MHMNKLKQKCTQIYLVSILRKHDNCFAIEGIRLKGSKLVLNTVCAAPPQTVNLIAFLLFFLQLSIQNCCVLQSTRTVLRCYKFIEICRKIAL